ncbi:hypothetical protein Z961_03330 [Clostridium haemolyticum NCTC 8350]|uniref:Ig-like domain-containing protein n=1 Tax=Clostridium haemolyticum TaxID=84025 RepID=UPI00052D9BD7|nr:Ig-like domain-containing protein [Clostridium haemolyticum]KGN04341.1 hypothetical protein Z961_03330 [Clostridium haemolyticum NCTC 8350]
MKNRRRIALIIASLVTFTLTPINFINKNVQATEFYTKYDKSSTKVQNKYDIKEKVLKVKQFENSTVILTKMALYFIKDGKVKKYDFSKNEILSSTNIHKDDRYICVSPYKKNGYYEILTIDTKNLSSKITNVSKYIDINNNDKLQEIVIDSNKNIWLLVYESNKKQYKLLKTSDKGKNYTKEKYVMKEREKDSYNNAITNVKVDDREKVYFKFMQVDKNGNNQYILKSISREGKEKNIKLKDDIRDYVIDENGCIWTISKEKVEYLSPSGERLKIFNGKDIKDITVDSRDNVWILDNDKIKEVYNDKIKDVYNVAKDSKEFSVYSKDNIVIKNTRGFTIKINGKDEEVLVDSYVANSAVVLKDKDSQIRILSDEYDNKSDYKMDDDVVLDVILKDNKFILNNKIRTNFSTYYNSMVYNGEVYLVRYNTLYKLKNNSMEEYIKFNKEEYNEFASGISFDKNDNIYIVGIKNIYVIDKNKNVDKIPLSKIYPDEVADENILLKDKNKDVYVITRTRKGIKLNKLDGKNFRTINYRFQDKKEPINIFLNEKDEFEFVYKDDKNGYKVYKLDENLLPQEDSRFNNEGLALMKTYNEIKNLKKTDDGKLILWIGKNMIYTKKRVEEKFIGIYDIGSNDIINSMVKGNDGRVYVGTSNSGVICYGQKIDKNPANYTEIVINQGDKVDKDKEWNIRFNKKLDKNSVNDNNIIVVREDGEIEPIKLTLNEEGNSIKITPEKKYKEQQSYYIFVTKNIKSECGKKLKKDIYGKFTVIKSNKIDDLAKFQIIEPVNIDIKNKEVMTTVINKWKDNVENEAYSKNSILKVGKVSVKEVKIAYDTAYILFNAEILNKVNDEIEKSEKNIGLNCKKVNKSWNIIK